jgi:predicted Zn-dependent protease/cellulose synthase/poly-beta-1,6-N-acetylglucosamine synthase-like glycosyltransferase
MGQKFRQFVILTSFAVCVFYLTYRLLFTLNLTTPYAVFASVFLLLGEAYGVFVLALFFLQVWDTRQPPPQPVLPGRTVDVFVPTYNEDPQLLRMTLEACRRLDYPHRTYLCDDGGTEARLKDPDKGPAAFERAQLLKKMCVELGAVYMPRPDNRHAKAGNLNHAFEKTDGEFIIILDADHVPEPHFISRLIGYFADEKLGFVQTPHAFYNFNNFQARFDHKNRYYWEEGHLFYEVIQPGRNRWNCPIFAGSAAMFRRQALKEVGYIATETITEDMHTGMRVNARGWKSLAISERLVVGQAAPDVTTFHSQRIRWGEGNLSIMAHDNPLTMKGLAWAQRFCYLGSMVHWAGGLFKLAVYLTPLLMMFTGVAPVAEFTWALAFITLFYLVSSVYGVRVASNGVGSFFNGELFCMINFWTQIRGTMRALFWRKFQKFVVTSKRGRQAKTIWPYVRPQVYLLGLSVLALFWGWYKVLIGVSDDYFKPAIPTFWILFHMLLALAVLRRALWPEDQRFATRHAVHLPVGYEALGVDADGNPVAGDRPCGLGVTVDLNDTGVGLIAYQPLPVGALVRLTLRGAGEVVECEGRIGWGKDLSPPARNGSGPEGYRYGIAFRDLRPEQTDAVNRITLHYAVPRLYGEYAQGRERTLGRRLAGWLAKGLVRRREALRRLVRLPLVLDPDGAPAHSVTEDASRTAMSALLTTPVAPGTRVDFLLATPLGEVRGQARALRGEPRCYAARTYQLCVFEFLQFTDQGRVTLEMVLNPREHPDLNPVLDPDREPLRVPVRRPLGLGLAAAAVMLVAALGAFRYVYRDDLFLRDVALAEGPVSEEETDRVEAVFNATLEQSYPSTDRLVLLMGAMERLNRPRQADQLTMMLAPRDRRNLDLQFALAQILDNTRDHPRAEAEYQRLLKKLEDGSLPPSRKRRLLLAAARASVHAGDLGRASQRFRELLRADPGSAAVRNEFAGVLMAAGKFPEAARLYRGVRPDLNGRLLLVSIHTRLRDFAAAERECRTIIRLRPNDAQAKLLLADVLSWKKAGYRQSRAIYEQLLRVNAGNADLHVRLAQIALWGRNYAEALQRFQALVGRRLDRPEIVKGYVDAAASADQLGEAQRRTALAIYERALTDTTDDVVFLARLAWVLQRVKEPQKSTVLLDRALELNPRDPNTRRQLLGALLASGRFNDKIREFEGKDLDFDTRLVLVHTYLGHKNFKAAAAQCRRMLRQRPDDPKTLRLLADLLSWNGKYRESLEVFGRLARVAPADREVAVRQAEVTLWGGDCNGALARFQALLEARFDRPALWPGYAAAAAGAGKLADSHRPMLLRIYGRAGAEDPRDVAFLGHLAWALHRLKETDQSRVLLDRAVALKPTEPAVRKELAGVLAAVGMAREAVRLYEGLTLTREDRCRLAGLYAAAKDFAGAASQLRAVLKERPGDARARRQLADVLSWKGDHAEALALLAQLARENPDDAELPVRQAEVALWSGDHGQALTLFEALLRARFDRPALWPGFVDAAAAAPQLTEGQARLARRLADQAAARSSRQPLFLARLAWVLHRLKEPARAAALLEQAVKLRPAEPADRKELAGVLAAAGKSKEAARLYRGLTLSLEDRYRLADIHAAGQDFAAAEQQLRAILEDRPQDLKALRQLADILSWKRDYPQALALLRQLVHDHPQDTALPVRLAEVTLWSGDRGKALTLFQALLRVRIDQPPLWPGFVDAAAGVPELTEEQAALARRLADQVATRSSGEPLFLGRLAWVLHRLKEPGRAAALLDQVVKILPRDPAARKELAGVLAAAGRGREAARLYQGLTLDLEDRYRLADMHAAGRDFAAAVTQLRLILKERPGDKRARRQLADVLSWKGDHAEALARLARLACEDPADAELPVRLAEVTLWSGDHARALTLVEALLRDRLDRPALWPAFADAAAAAPQLTEEQAALVRRLADQAAARSSRQPLFLARLAWVLHRLKEPARAQALLDQAVKLRPAEPTARKELAGVLAAAGKSKEAARLYRGLTLSLEDRFRLADLHTAAQDFAAAGEQLQAILKDRPQDPRALRKLADVLSWKKDYPQALALLRRLAQTDPQDTGLAVRLAEVTLWSGDHDGALGRFQALLKVDFDQPRLWPGFVDAAAGAPRLTAEQARLARRIADRAAGSSAGPQYLARLAWVLHRLKEPARARALLDQAVALKPVEPAARRELTGVLAAVGKSREAVSLYQGLPLDLEDRHRLAGLYASTRDYAAAVRQLRAILRKKPGDTQTMRLLAAVLTWKRDYREARALLQQLADANPADAELPVRLAEVMVWSGDHEHALPRLQALLKARFDRPELWRIFVDAAASTPRLTASQVRLAGRIADRAAADRSTDVALLARLAWLLYRAREPARAATLLDRAVALKPADMGLRRELAGTLAAVGKVQDALRMYEGVPLDPEDRYHLIGVHATALKQARALLEDAPDDAEAQQLSAYVLGWQKVVQQSLALFDRLARESPKDDRLQVRRAEVTLWSGNYDRALEYFQALLAGRFDRPELWRSYIDAAASARLALTDAHRKMALRLYDRRAGLEPRVEYLSRLAWVLLRLKDRTRAGRLLDRALALRPEDPAVRKELAGVLAAAERFREARRLYLGLKLTLADRCRLAEIDAASGEFASAEREVRVVLRLKPGYLPARYLLASVLTRGKRFADAARVYEELRRACPDDPAIPVKVAELSLWGGAYDTALARFQKLLDRDPDRTALWKGYIDAAASARAVPASARKAVVHIYEQVRGSESEDPVFLGRLAWVLRRVKELKRSSALLRQALAREPRSRGLRLRLAETLYEAGHYREAEAHFKALLKK